MAYQHNKSRAVVKAGVWLALVALTGCAKCLPDRSNVPCEIGFHHAPEWDEMGYEKPSKVKFKRRALVDSSI